VLTRNGILGFISSPYLDDLPVGSGVSQLEDIGSGRQYLSRDFYRVAEGYDGFLIPIVRLPAVTSVAQSTAARIEI
jgi:hypothetical protein